MLYINAIIAQIVWHCVSSATRQPHNIPTQKEETVLHRWLKMKWVYKIHRTYDRQMCCSTMSERLDTYTRHTHTVHRKRVKPSKRCRAIICGHRDSLVCVHICSQIVHKHTHPQAFWMLDCVAQKSVYLETPAMIAGALFYSQRKSFIASTNRSIHCQALFVCESHRA